MKISNVRLRDGGDHVLLTADCHIRHFGPDKAYFKFDKRYKDFISADAAPFLAALLVPAMKLGENIIIEGAISERLYEGIQEIMKVWLSWNLGLKPISVFVDELKKDEYAPKENASFFSGGVDSFYTYLKNKRFGGDKIKYFILANGYDIALDNHALWEETRKTVENVARAENIEVIEIESNIRSLIDPIMIWDYAHGGCMAALGLAVRKKFKNIYIASSYYKESLFPWGSHPDIDPLWSTETLSFHHDGIEASRLQKVKFIANEPVVAKNLRVCYLNVRGKFNCGKCDKCVRTMINLHIAGALEKAETFPRSIDLTRVRNLKIIGEHAAIHHKDNLADLDLADRDADAPLRNAIREALSNTSEDESDFTEIVLKLSFLDFYYCRSALSKIVRFIKSGKMNSVAEKSAELRIILP